MCLPKGATRTKDAKELLYARQKVVTTAKAFGLQAIDLVYIDYKDVEGLRQQAREGALMGFTGKAHAVVQLILFYFIFVMGTLDSRRYAPPPQNNVMATIFII